MAIERWEALYLRKYTGNTEGPEGHMPSYAINLPKLGDAFNPTQIHGITVESSGLWLSPHFSINWPFSSTWKWQTLSENEKLLDLQTPPFLRSSQKLQRWTRVKGQLHHFGLNINHENRSRFMFFTRFSDFSPSMFVFFLRHFLPNKIGVVRTRSIIAAKMGVKIIKVVCMVGQNMSKLFLYQVLRCTSLYQLFWSIFGGSLGTPCGWFRNPNHQLIDGNNKTSHYNIYI